MNEKMRLIGNTAYDEINENGKRNEILERNENWKMEFIEIRLFLLPPWHTHILLFGRMDK